MPDTLSTNANQPHAGHALFSTPAKHRRTRRSLFRLICKLTLCLGLLIALGLTAFIWQVSQGLPPLHSLENYRPWQITRVLDVNGHRIMELAEQRRRVVSYQSLPKHLIHALISAEDAYFFQHKGLSYSGILRAFLKNLRRPRGAPKQGGSTITQQVVKTFLLTPRQTYTRKLREALLARRLEQNLRKWEILYLYLNQIDFGRGCYGVEEAARYYFHKRAKDLSITESAILAGIPKNPERYNPAHSIRLTTQRRNYVLKRMWENGYLSKKTYLQLKASPVKPHVAPPPLPFQHDYYTEAVRQRALHYIERYLHKVRKIRSPHERKRLARTMLYRGGLRIETALDPRAQRYAQHALQRGLRTIDRRQGFRGPIRHIDRPKWRQFLQQLRLRNASPSRPIGLQMALVTARTSDGYQLAVAQGVGLLPWHAAAWAVRKQEKKPPIQAIKMLLRPGDVIWVRTLQSPHKQPIPHIQQPLKTAPQAPNIRYFSLEQVPLVQGALIAIDPRSHQVRALVGGWDFRTHPFNRAISSRRQPGSAFQPILYAAALSSRRFTAATLFDDQPLALLLDGKIWRPTNFHHKFSNKPMRLREALVHSNNTIAVRLFNALGPYHTIAMARKLGISSPLTRKPTLALGASPVQPLALTNAYATLAAQGLYDQPTLITRILTHNGNTIYDHLPSPRRVLSPGVAHITINMLQDVVKRGAAQAALALKRPIAGKSGTTNHATNAWFIGCTPTICAGVWVGYDDKTPLGPKESGARTALPIFIDWIKQYHTRPDGSSTPPLTFQAPDDIVSRKIDPSDGDLAPAQHTHPLTELFLKGTEPTRYSSNYGPIAK